MRYRLVTLVFAIARVQVRSLKLVKLDCRRGEIFLGSFVYFRDDTRDGVLLTNQQTGENLSPCHYFQD